MNSSNRDLCLIFRADSCEPFLRFAQEMRASHESVKYAEFHYDDGGFHCTHVDADEVSEDPDTQWDYTSELLYDRMFTGREDIDKVVEIWAKEVQATAAEKTSKIQRLREALRQDEEQQERWRARAAKRQQRAAGITPPLPGGAVSEETSRPRVRYALPPNLSKKAVIDIIQKLNTSGEVIIPVYILRDEVGPRLGKNDMIERYLFLERSPIKGQMFELVRTQLGKFQS